MWVGFGRINLKYLLVDNLGLKRIPDAIAQFNSTTDAIAQQHHLISIDGTGLPLQITPCIQLILQTSNSFN
ncbi:hypothetical protein VNO78_12646 [Psophocarpus tetragonolobus]|uniref:Uncharacterized protein n=1 Tax=Psophocarpus tetragonolobus TaxID=3891 RepID=A0AAN9SNB2_PSOTE